MNAYVFRNGNTPWGRGPSCRPARGGRGAGPVGVEAPAPSRPAGAWGRAPARGAATGRGVAERPADTRALGAQAGQVPAEPSQSPQGPPIGPPRRRGSGAVSNKPRPFGRLQGVCQRVQCPGRGKHGAGHLPQGPGPSGGFGPAAGFSAHRWENPPVRRRGPGATPATVFSSRRRRFPSGFGTEGALDAGALTASGVVPGGWPDAPGTRFPAGLDTASTRPR